MIFLSSDLHHSSLHTGNQEYSDIKELETAKIFLDILEEQNIKVNFFISGKCFEEELDLVLPLCQSPLVEIGGHNYNCFKPDILHRIFKILLGSYPGPTWYQMKDINKTKAIIKKHTNKDIQIWRNHMYMHGPNTNEALKRCGIDFCSDGVKKFALPQIDKNNLIDFPINVIPDHEHIYHAERTKEWVEDWVKRYNWSDDFGSESYPIEEWGDIVIANIKENEAKGIDSNIIIHPITMYLADNFKTFKRIMTEIDPKQTQHYSYLIKKMFN